MPDEKIIVYLVQFSQKYFLSFDKWYSGEDTQFFFLSLPEEKSLLLTSSANHWMSVFFFIWTSLGCIVTNMEILKAFQCYSDVNFVANLVTASVKDTLIVIATVKTTAESFVLTAVKSFSQRKRDTASATWIWFSMTMWGRSLWLAPKSSHTCAASLTSWDF